jgi:hypothetical protein
MLQARLALLGALFTTPGGATGALKEVGFFNQARAAVAACSAEKCCEAWGSCPKPTAVNRGEVI